MPAITSLCSSNLRADALGNSVAKLVRKVSLPSSSGNSRAGKIWNVVMGLDTSGNLCSSDKLSADMPSMPVVCSPLTICSSVSEVSVRWVCGLKNLMLSISVSNKSRRSGNGCPIAKISMMLPRTANSPGSKTLSTKR